MCMTNSEAVKISVAFPGQQEPVLKKLINILIYKSFVVFILYGNVVPLVAKVSGTLISILEGEFVAASVKCQYVNISIT